MRYPIEIKESDVFLNGSSSLNHTGIGIQFIRNELAFLQEGWDGKGEITPQRQGQVIDEIAESFVIVSESLGIPPDFSLIPEVVGQYNKIAERRMSNSDKPVVFSDPRAPAKTSA